MLWKLERMKSLALITLDSLRYDVALHCESHYTAPNLRELGIWRKCFAPGHYTLPSHMSMLVGGILPENHGDEALYNRARGALFGYEGWGRRGRYQLPAESSSVVNGFERMGYHTIGIGGVGWFGKRPTSAMWAEMFQWWQWDESYHELNPASFERQLDDLMVVRGVPTFLFLNVSATHRPYRGADLTVDAQIKALEYVDRHIPTLIERLPHPCTLIICGDHGDCMGEDGLSGHGFYHEKVMEVPMMITEIE